jgi:hypothetical protein
MPRAARWARSALVLTALAVLLSACKVDTTVDVKVREDGSGVVRLVVRADAEAVKAAESGGVSIDQAVRLQDVAEAGFRVGTWQKAQDGSATIVISRPFDSVSEVEGIVRALNGADGPLPALRATRDHGLIATDYGVNGRIDLDKVTTGVNDDQELVARLQALGVDVAKIDTQLLAQIRSSFSLDVVVRLPGQEPVLFTPTRGATTGNVDASTQIVDTERIALFAAALALLVIAAIVWIRGGKRRRRPRTPAQSSAPRPVAPAPVLGGRAQAPSRRGPHVPHPHLPPPHHPQPHLPQPHVPRPHLPGPPPPPRRPKPPDGVAGSE